MWLVDVVSRRCVWLVGVATGCGCKEVQERKTFKNEQKVGKKEQIQDK